MRPPPGTAITAAPVLFWVSQHYNLISFCGEKKKKKGRGLNLVTFFLQLNSSLFLLALIPREVKMTKVFKFHGHFDMLSGAKRESVQN